MDNRIISVSMWFHIPSTLPTVKSIIVIQIKIYVEIFLSKNTGKCTAVKTIAKHGKKKKNVVTESYGAERRTKEIYVYRGA